MIINHYAGSKIHGMEYRPFYLAKEWVRLGHKVSIVAASFSHLHSQSPNINGDITEEVIEGIRYFWIKTPKYRGNGIGRVLNMLVFSWMLFRHKSKIMFSCNPDLVIASSPHPFTIFGASKIAHTSKAKLFFEVRDIWPLTLIELGGMSRFHPFVMLTQWAENFAYRVSDRVISLLPRSESYMKEHGMAAEKFIYLPNGIDIIEWQNDHKAPATILHASMLSQLKQEGKFIVGYAGSHGMANGLYTFIEAASLLQSQTIVFVLVGQGPEKKNLQQKVLQAGMKNVLFLPSVQKSHIPGLLSFMDVLYIGLKDESLFRFGVSPNKLMDYMMAAKPVIHAIKAGNDMVSECGCGISVPPENSEAIAKAVIQLMGMTPTERKKMGLRGKQYVSTYHDYRVLAKQLLRYCHE